MFRCLAWRWGKQGRPEDDSSLQKLGDETRIVFSNNEIYCNDEDVTAAIRTEEISMLASEISRFPLIREVMKKQQRKLVENVKSDQKFNGAVLEGRDIGTVVFPDAEIKFYVDASPEVRAKRRTLQLQEKGEKVDYAAILKALEDRDYQDKNRKVAPLKAADDAIIVDTGEMDVDQVLSHLISLVESR